MTNATPDAPQGINTRLLNLVIALVGIGVLIWIVFAGIPMIAQKAPEARKSVVTGTNKIASGVQEIAAEPTERAIGERLAKESAAFIVANVPGARQVTEVPPGKGPFGAPDKPWFEWKTAASDIRKNLGRENFPLYVEYTYLDYKGLLHHIMLKHYEGKWEILHNE